MALPLLCLLPAVAGAEDIASAYTRFTLAGCEQIEKPDGYVFEGSWRCPGHGGVGFTVAVADARSFVGFGPGGGNNCAFSKTFLPPNTALSPVEWRLRNGRPFAAIERWNVGDETDPAAMSWLVVSALRANDSCHVHYVAGTFPDANAAARRAADTLAESFDCENGIPEYDSTIGPPPIELNACRDIARE